jgi:bifunctional DNase/RNase
MGTTIKRAGEKRFYLSIGIIIFILGVLSIPCVVGFGLLNTQPQVQLIVLDEKIPDFKMIPIEFEINSTRTIPLTLLKMDEKSYTIQLMNGDIIQLNKSWIKVLIIKR